MTRSSFSAANPDGSTVQVSLYAPANPKYLFVVFPAMGVFARYYKQLAEELSANGVITALADLRGNDTSGIRPNTKTDFGYREQLELDFDTVITKVKNKYPDLPIYLLGHSLGGQLSCLYASRNTEKIDGLILSATCSVYYKGWKGLSAYRILAGTQFANLVAKTLGYFPGKKIGFGGLEAKTVIRDWSHQSRTGRYELKNDSFHYEKALSELKIPVLAVSYQGDGLCPKGAVQHLLSKLKAASIEHIHLEKDDPRNDGYDHFNWAKKPKNLVNLIMNWMEQLDQS